MGIQDNTGTLQQKLNDDCGGGDVDVFDDVVGDFGGGGESDLSQALSEQPCPAGPPCCHTRLHIPGDDELEQDRCQLSALNLLRIVNEPSLKI